MILISNIKKIKKLFVHKNQDFFTFKSFTLLLADIFGFEGKKYLS